jgi:putative toxin-antitoxin system antitoxin component (TIGR02293 family)
VATQFADVEELLGLENAKGSRLALADSVENGLPLSALERLAGQVSPGDTSFKFRLIPKATFERRKRAVKKILNREESDRIARLAKVFSLAESVYGTPDGARAFLTRPHMMLDGKLPLDVALATGPGADVVSNILGRAAYGAAV